MCAVTHRPTVCQSMRMSSLIFELDMFRANHATWRSNSLVKRESGKAQGTASVTMPWTGQWMRRGEYRR